MLLVTARMSNAVAVKFDTVCGGNSTPLKNAPAQLSCRQGPRGRNIGKS